MNKERMKELIFNSIFVKEAFHVLPDQGISNELIEGDLVQTVNYGYSTTIINNTGVDICEVNVSGIKTTYESSMEGLSSAQQKHLREVFAGCLIIGHYRVVADSNCVYPDANLSEDERKRANDFINELKRKQSRTRGVLAPPIPDTLYHIVYQAIPLDVLTKAGSRGIYVQRGGLTFVLRDAYKSSQRIISPGLPGYRSSLLDCYVPHGFVNDVSRNLNGDVYTTLANRVVKLKTICIPDVPEGIILVNTYDHTGEEVDFDIREGACTDANLAKWGAFKTYRDVVNYINGNTPEALKHELELDVHKLKHQKQQSEMEKMFIEHRLQSEQAMINQRIQNSKNAGELLKAFAGIIVAGFGVFKLLSN